MELRKKFYGSFREQGTHSLDTPPPSATLETLVTPTAPYLSSNLSKRLDFQNPPNYSSILSTSSDVKLQPLTSGPSTPSVFSSGLGLPATNPTVTIGVPSTTPTPIITTPSTTTVVTSVTIPKQTVSGTNVTVSNPILTTVTNLSIPTVSTTTITTMASGSQSQDSVRGKPYHQIVKLENYTGETSINSWLNKFDNYCLLNRTDKQEHSTVLPFFLSMNASVFYSELPSNVKSNIDDLKLALRQRYQQDSKYIDFTILTAKQGAHESINDFLSRLFKLCQDKDVPETIIISVAIFGFKPGIRKFVVLSKPKTLSELVSVAKLAETTE